MDKDLLERPKKKQNRRIIRKQHNFIEITKYVEQEFLGFAEIASHHVETKINENYCVYTEKASTSRTARPITRKERWEENIEFVNNIWQFAPLHNRYHADYKNPQITDKLWCVVSRRMNWPVIKCQRKWTYFKSIFRSCLENNRKHYLERIMKYNVPYMTIFYDMAIPSNKQYFPELDGFYKDFSNVVWSSLIDPRDIFEEKERDAMVKLKTLIYEGRMRQLQSAKEQLLQQQQQDNEENIEAHEE